MPCFSANVQMPNNTLASTKYDMLELNPTSTECTHGAADKLFCRYTCHWPEPSTTQCKVSRPWDGRPPRWAVYNFDVPMSDKSVT